MRRHKFRTGLMLGAMVLATATGAGVSAQGVRIDQMPGAYNRDEAPDSQQPPHVRPDGTVGGNIYVPWNDEPDSTSCGLGQRPSVVAVPAKGTIIESDTPGKRAPNPASRAPDPQEIACVYARASAANSNGAFNWIGGNTVVSVQPLLNLEMARYEFRITPSSVRCVKTKTPGHRCNYTVTMVAVKGQGMSGMTAAFSGGVRPTVVTRADQFERSASGLASSSLNRAWASAPRTTTTTSADDRRRQAEQTEQSQQSMKEDQRRTLGCDNPFNPWGPPPGC
ncbi:MAG: hypothetical protein LKM31_17125 [Sphingobium sp.]|nr:hypothetical protein [Sphingobium sp.]MCI2053178.1 hypothetical protein [Sphingobium sp.]